jgi:hypothetical protein
MIETWLNLPAFGIFALLTVLYAAGAAAIIWGSFGRRFGPSVQRMDGIVPPFFGAVGLLFALMAGFLASDISERNRQAVRVVQAETAELRNVFTLSVASKPDMRDIRAAWTDYIKAVTGAEWQAMLHGDSAPVAAQAYDKLLREVSDPGIVTEAGAAVHAALVNAAIHIGTARSERLALASDSTNGLKWTIVLILGVMTQVSIGIVHLGKRNAQIGALTVFSLATAITLGLIAMQEYPFAGDVRLPPTPLQDLLKLHGPAD